jgi:hypothetical protein
MPTIVLKVSLSIKYSGSYLAILLHLDYVPRHVLLVKNSDDIRVIIQMEHSYVFITICYIGEP